MKELGLCRFKLPTTLPSSTVEITRELALVNALETDIYIERDANDHFKDIVAVCHRAEGGDLVCLFFLSPSCSDNFSLP